MHRSHGLVCTDMCTGMRIDMCTGMCMNGVQACVWNMLSRSRQDVSKMSEDQPSATVSKTGF